MTQEQPPSQTPDDSEPAEIPSQTPDDSGAAEIPPSEFPQTTPDLQEDVALPKEPLQATTDAQEAGDWAAIAQPAIELSEPVPTATPQAPAVQSQTLQRLQAFWQTTQPKLKAGTVMVLKATIQVLQILVQRLESAPAPTAPGDASTSEAVPAPEQPPSQPTDQSAAQPIPDAPVEPLGEKPQARWQQSWAWWNGFLPKIRGLLPASVNQSLSDRALTGAIASILILFLWTTTSLLSSKPPTQVATSPASKSAPAKTPSSKVPSSQDKPTREPAPSAMAPTASPQVTPSPTATPGLDESKPVTELPKPSPSPDMSPAPKPSPPPLKLTPEQTLIAQIQDQVAEVSNQYVSGIIQSVQANFRTSRLTVKVDNGWYGLAQAQQDNLANDILHRAQQLNFSKLEITDPEGGLLARSPVVGSEMVVLKRIGKSQEMV